MTNTAAETRTIPACTCGNCPAIRIARGLVPFCQMESAGRTVRPGFGTYAEAAAARKDGQKIVSMGNRLHSGSAKRFFLV